jgi:hypothetical protein
VLIDGVMAAPRRRRFRMRAVVGITICALAIGVGATAAADSNWTRLLGAQPDASVAVIVANPGQAGQACQIGILAQSANTDSTTSPHVLAVQKFLRTHDWSHLRPDPSQVEMPPEFAAAHKIDMRPIIAGTVLTQITDAVQQAGLMKTDVVLRGVVDCGIGSKK